MFGIAAQRSICGISQCRCFVSEQYFAKVAPAVDSLLEDARLAPCLAEAAFHNAVLTLALAGVEALQATEKHPKYSTSKTRKDQHAQHVHHH